MSGEDGAFPHPRPRKRFGQHFLEAAWVAKLVAAVAPTPEDVFIEIGPGRGALTRALAPRVGRLVCVEIDRDLADALRTSMPPHVEVVEADFLDVDVRALIPEAAGRVRVIGNLPYNISSPILFKLVASADEGRVLKDATVMLQKEVADRMTAVVGTAEYGTLSVQIARVADVVRLLTLPPGAFRPPPKVTSAVVQLRFRPAAEDVGDAATFERVVRGVFLQRRKTLHNALVPVTAALGRSPDAVLERAGLDGRKRPQELTLADFARLSRAVL